MNYNREGSINETRLYTLKKQNQSGNPALSRGREGVFQQVTVLYVKNSGQNDRSFV
ncbi:hypothetical protein A943_02270 [Bacillus sp. CPSM8]|nr:hypothetical protein A943_02270 [Bacillus sp. CPSM8]KUL06262.1 hypothetical protein LI7559_21615 [Bacillus licheniformis LMG 7559]KUL16933.1 hypothetical protein LI6934_13310 [Bacillus licheniformis LMG 6934]